MVSLNDQPCGPCRFNDSRGNVGVVETLIASQDEHVSSEAIRPGTVGPPKPGGQDGCALVRQEPLGRSVYYEPAEQPTVDRFLAGDPQDPTEVDSLKAWYALVSRVTADGAIVARVRVQEDPPNRYQQWERWITPWNVAAGEDMRYLTEAAAHSIGLLPAAHGADWWLLDDSRLIVMEFDAEGRRVRSSLITEPERVNQAKQWWRLAYEHSARIENGEAA